VANIPSIANGSAISIGHEWGRRNCQSLSRPVKGAAQNRENHRVVGPLLPSAASRGKQNNLVRIQPRHFGGGGMVIRGRRGKGPPESGRRRPPDGYFIPSSLRAEHRRGGFGPLLVGHPRELAPEAEGVRKLDLASPAVGASCCAGVGDRSSFSCFPESIVPNRLGQTESPSAALGVSAAAL